jgi:hypothetical protein
MARKAMLPVCHFTVKMPLHVSSFTHVRIATSYKKLARRGERSPEGAILPGNQITGPLNALCRQQGAQASGTVLGNQHTCNHDHRETRLTHEWRKGKSSGAVRASRRRRQARAMAPLRDAVTDSRASRALPGSRPIHGRCCAGECSAQSRRSSSTLTCAEGTTSGRHNVRASTVARASTCHEAIGAKARSTPITAEREGRKERQGAACRAPFLCTS